MNQTFTSDFILLGLLDPNQYGLLFLLLILIIFMVAIMGNTILILLIHLDTRLHTPMYFLLKHLSFMDILTISNIVPMMAINYISGNKFITFAGCGFQLFCYVNFVGTECLIITAMSYDRYVANCHPLRYPILMNHRISVILAAGCWIGGIINSTMNTIYILLLPFCGKRIIEHFFCEQIVYVCAVFFFLIPFSIIIFSYGQILRIVINMKFKEAQKKAFSTWSSHLAVVAMYYGSCIFTYMRPKSYHTPSQEKVVAILYTILAPMLNPLIYSLRNKDVLCALKDIMETNGFLQKNKKCGN
ncbi:olfactory receptor 2AJ1-like [Macrotis lagotis]|uniref:olfactory receptor 2AJ1-like n=1 Tax=Macrotis lagotis TaxID=92651 RepID=UPI003D692DD3